MKQKVNNKATEFSWSSRRRFLKYILAFCSFNILYIMFKNQDTTIHRVILDNSFLLMGSVWTVYITGKTTHETILGKSNILMNNDPVKNSGVNGGDEDGDK